MRVSLIWRSFLRVLWGLHVVAVGCGPLSEPASTGELASQRSLVDKQCSPPARVSDIRPGPTSAFPPITELPAMVAAQGGLYFLADDGVHGQELWRSDGTEQGTLLVKDIRQGSVSSAIQQLTPAGSGIYFTANDGTHGRELWKSDGTATGTALVEELQPGPVGPEDLGNLMVVGELLYFSTEGSTLWRTNGQAGGTVRLKDFLLPRNNEGPFMAALGDTLIFAGDDDIRGMELWKSDGTPQGTTRVRDIHAREGSGPDWLVSMNGRVLFNADDGVLGRELWITDGTTLGTTQMMDIWPGLADSAPHELVVKRDRLFFIANDGSDGPNLWTSDGSTSGTVRVTDFTAGFTGPDLTDLTVGGAQSFFRYAEPGHGSALWRSDGTDSGTYRLKDMLPELEEAHLQRMLGVGDTLYFVASDEVNGAELWKSDGTPEGTALVMDIAPGAESSFPRGLTRVGMKVFFVAWEPTAGEELWAFDICDRAPPQMTCPESLAIEATSLEGAQVSYSVSATDDLTDEPTLEYSHPPGSTFPVGITPVKVTARDEAGNASECIIPINVQDTTPPAVTCPRSLILEPTSSEGAEVRYPEVMVADQASPVQLVFEPPAGTLLPPGESTRVLLSASDNSGNTTTCRFSVTVELFDEEGKGGSSGCGCGAPAGGLGWAALLWLLVLARLSLPRK